MLITGQAWSGNRKRQQELFIGLCGSTLSNATANEQYFAEERARLVAQILSAVQSMNGALLRKVDVTAKISEAATKFEKETYDNEESER